jgi:hypothetical protein
MTELEAFLRKRETVDLQRAISRRELTEEAAAIAGVILRERNAVVPDLIPEVELEAEHRGAHKLSNIRLVVFIVCGVTAIATGALTSGHASWAYACFLPWIGVMGWNRRTR